jgi:hypothetical protein
MALKHIILVGSLLATFFVSTTTTSGQTFKPGPTFRHRGVESVNSTRPMATPGVFDYDTQVWAPVDFTNNDEMESRTGFYASMDRVYTSFNKAGNFNGVNGTEVSNGSHFLWGNRMEFGWLSTPEDGWGLVYQQSDGIHYTNGQDILVSNPMLVKSYLANVEINRFFRQSLKNGGYFEPFIGFRYMNVTDTTIEDTVQFLNFQTVANRFKQDVQNNAFGAHAGGRYTRHAGRWRTSSKGAIATTYNRQRYFATDIASSVPVDGFPAIGILEFYDAGNSFTPVLDLQFDLAYYVTRDISIRAGLQSWYMWDGVARANTVTTSLNPNSAFGFGLGGPQGLFQDNVFTAGIVFGVEWHR